jgi:hypothetical protein
MTRWANNLEWSAEQINVPDAFTQFIFIGPTPGPIGVFNSPLDCLELFMTEEVINIIAEESERMAQKKFKNRPWVPTEKHRDSRSIQATKEIKSIDIWQYIGYIIFNTRNSYIIRVTSKTSTKI